MVEDDIRNPAELKRAFAASPGGVPIEEVIHFAGLKAGGESVREPLPYLDVNLNGSRQLLVAVQEHGWHTRRSLADICRDGWAWQSANPNVYSKIKGNEP